MEKLVMIYFALTNRIAEITDKDRGATATEYAILVAFVALVIAAGALLFGNALSKWFGDLATSIGGWATNK